MKTALNHLLVVVFWLSSLALCLLLLYGLFTIYTQQPTLEPYLDRGVLVCTIDDKPTFVSQPTRIRRPSQFALWRIGEDAYYAPRPGELCEIRILHPPKS